MSFVFRRIRVPHGILNADLTAFTQSAALAFATILSEDLAAGTRHGKWWVQFGNPRRSSKRGEPEQEQYGTLRDSIAAQPAEADQGLAFAQDIGFFNEDPEKLNSLEVNRSDIRYRGHLTFVVHNPDNQAFAMTEGLDGVREYGSQ